MLAAATTSFVDCGVRNLGATICKYPGPSSREKIVRCGSLAPEMGREQLLSLKCHVAAAGNLGGGRTALQVWSRGDEDNESRQATNRILCDREARQRAAASGGGQSV